jgi:Caspase domain
MVSASRALLIASPYGGLLGPENDVEMLASVLKRYGFDIERCCGLAATRDGILRAWQQLIDDTSSDDAVVIYYSGHGGLTEASPTKGKDLHWSEKQWYSQYIVPMDFDETSVDDFRGIPDIELSYMLRDTVNKTRNVTIILDCCHSARLSRIAGVRPKALPRTLHYDISAHIQRLRDQGVLLGDTFVEGNPYAVRLVAAATRETAWEYENAEGRSTGAFTEALASVLDVAWGKKISWRTALLQVCELVNVAFPAQHPQLEGPDSRIMFSMGHANPKVQLAKMMDSHVVIQGGRIAGVRKDNVYAIMPFGAEVVSAREQIARAKVTDVDGLTADATVTFLNRYTTLPLEGALAFLEAEGIHRWPIRIEADAQYNEVIKSELDSSDFLRVSEQNDRGTALVTLRQHDKTVHLFNSRSTQLGSQSFTDDNSFKAAIEAIIPKVELLGRAQHLLRLEGGTDGAALEVPLKIEFGRVRFGEREIVPDDGAAVATEGDLIYISLRNPGAVTLHVSVFDICVTGFVRQLLSKSWPNGIEIPPGRDYTIGAHSYSGELRGLKLGWPDSVPRCGITEETLIFIIADTPIDLRQLATNSTRRSAVRGGLPGLEGLMYHLAYGVPRFISTDGEADVRYSVSKINFWLKPRTEREAAT